MCLGNEVEGTSASSGWNVRSIRGASWVIMAGWFIVGEQRNGGDARDARQNSPKVKFMRREYMHLWERTV